MQRLFFYFDVGVGVEGDFLSLNLLIIIRYIVYVQIYTYAKGIVGEQSLMSFKI